MVKKKIPGVTLLRHLSGLRVVSGRKRPSQRPPRPVLEGSDGPGMAQGQDSHRLTRVQDYSDCAVLKFCSVLGNCQNCTNKNVHTSWIQIQAGTLQWILAFAHEAKPRFNSAVQKRGSLCTIFLDSWKLPSPPTRTFKQRWNMAQKKLLNVTWLKMQNVRQTLIKVALSKLDVRLLISCKKFFT